MYWINNYHIQIYIIESNYSKPDYNIKLKYKNNIYLPIKNIYFSFNILYKQSIYSPYNRIINYFLKL
jgi:hypothetical protein